MSGELHNISHRTWKAETETQVKLANQTGSMAEPWVHLKDPSSENKETLIAEDRVSALGRYMHVGTCPHKSTCMHIVLTGLCQPDTS